MNQFATKFKLIFLPFVFVAVCTICLYTFLNWLLLIKLNAFKIDDIIVNLYIPMALPWLPLLIWLRPRIKLLKLKKGYKKDPVGGILFVNWISIGLPLIIAQVYISTATGKLTRLDYISQIYSSPTTKYYTVKHFYSNKSMVHLKATFDVSGKYSSDFNMTVYASVPVFDHVFPDTNRIAAIRNSVNAKSLIIINGKLSTILQLKKLPADSIRIMSYVNPSFVMPKYGEAGKYGAIAVITKGYKTNSQLPLMKISPIAWLAVKYTKTISNQLSVAEKRESFQEFLSKNRTEFMQSPLDKFVYLGRLSYNKDFKNYEAAIYSLGDVVGGEPIILSPVYKPFADRNGNKLAWIFGSLGIGAGVFLLILQFIPLRNISDIQSYKSTELL
jgi:hypothetical protein